MPKKLTKEIVNERLEPRGLTLIGDFVNVATKSTFRCAEGHEWDALPGNVMAGSGCPHCAGLAPLTKEIVNARIADRGIKLVGEYVNQRTKATFRCAEGHEWNATPSAVMGGSGCMRCSGPAPLTKDIVNARLAERGIELIGEYVNQRTKATFRCAEGHEWNAVPNSVMAGSGCPHCAGLAPLTKDIVNARLADRGIELIGEFVSVNIKSKFRCGEDHEWATVPTSVLNMGTGCPTCAKTGFNPDAPAILYYLRVTSVRYGETFKIGITNNDVETRFAPADLKRIDVIKTWDFERGQDAKDREAMVLRDFAEDRIDTGDLFVSGGNTEMFNRDVLGLAA